MMAVRGCEGVNNHNKIADNVHIVDVALELIISRILYNLGMLLFIYLCFFVCMFRKNSATNICLIN